jgi:hypothetical protein
MPTEKEGDGRGLDNPPDNHQCIRHGLGYTVTRLVSLSAQA